jgi:hypothetical protein
MRELTGGGKGFGSFRKVSSSLDAFYFLVQDPGFIVFYIFTTGLEEYAECLFDLHD